MAAWCKYAERQTKEKPIVCTYEKIKGHVCYGQRYCRMQNQYIMHESVKRSCKYYKIK